jgi:hypothetical protein
MSKNKTASLRVRYALDHHAQVLKPLFEGLQHALDFSGVMQSFGSRLGGANSNYFDTPQRRYHIKGIVRPTPGIEVRYSPRGPVVVKLKNERDAIRFVEGL